MPNRSKGGVFCSFPGWFGCPLSGYCPPDGSISFPLLLYVDQFFRHYEITRHSGEKASMATDYDAPRKTDDDLEADSIEELKARRVDKGSSTVDVDESELAEGLELPGADLSDESLSVRVLPRQADEFTCSRCFLVHHRSQLVFDLGAELVCAECSD
jgi:hypothetical protein